MTLTPGYLEPPLPMVSAIGPWSLIWAHPNTSPSSGAYEAANRGVWYPISVPTVTVAKRMWWANGSTVSASYNVEAGIYRSAGFKPGAKLITTGSVAQGTASQVQFSDITDTVLTPETYWLYISCSTTSATFFRFNYATGPEVTMFEQGSIGPGSAPATATPAEATGANFYLFGFSTTTIT